MSGGHKTARQRLNNQIELQHLFVLQEHLLVPRTEPWPSNGGVKLSEHDDHTDNKMK